MNRALHRLDLNLLVTLQILLSERSVTRAAKRLSVTPSAVSKSLTKLRHWFDDPLLVRSPQDLLPTPLALALAEELAELFQLASSIVAKRNVEVPKGV
ncbi:LysR family transcriptional regulator [Shewanella algae]|nr:LysR family transcriptional regulator [Shewanella algae]